MLRANTLVLRRVDHVGRRIPAASRRSYDDTMSFVMDAPSEVQQICDTPFFALDASTNRVRAAALARSHLPSSNTTATRPLHSFANTSETS